MMKLFGTTDMNVIKVGRTLEHNLRVKY